MVYAGVVLHMHLQSRNNEYIWYLKTIHISNYSTVVSLSNSYPVSHVPLPRETERERTGNATLLSLTFVLVRCCPRCSLVLPFFSVAVVVVFRGEAQ